MPDPQSRPEDGHELVVVANRLPVDSRTLPDGATEWVTSPGGLVTAMESVMRTVDSGAWVGWPGGGGAAPDPFVADGMHLYPVSLSPDEVERYYEGFSNATLWPLYHDVIVDPEFHRTWWYAYQSVNRRFARTAAEVAAPPALDLSLDEVLARTTTSSSSSPRCCARRAPTPASASSTTSPSRRWSCSASSPSATRSCAGCWAPTWWASSARATP